MSWMNITPRINTNDMVSIPSAGRTHITLKKLQRFGIIEKTAPDWEKITIALELDDDGHKIDTIKRDCWGLGVQTCCLQAFQLWLKGKGKQPVTWATLVGCLEDVGYNTLADEIQEKLHLEYCASNGHLLEGRNISATYGAYRGTMGESYAPCDMPSTSTTAISELSTGDKTNESVRASLEASSYDRVSLHTQEAGALVVFPSADPSTSDNQANAHSSSRENMQLPPEQTDPCPPPLQKGWIPPLHQGTSSTSVGISQLSNDTGSQGRVEIYPGRSSFCAGRSLSQSSQALEDSHIQVSFVLPRSHSITSTTSAEFSVGQDSIVMDRSLHGVSHYSREIPEYSRYQSDHPTRHAYSVTSSTPDLTTSYRCVSADHSMTLDRGSKGLTHLSNEKLQYSEPYRRYLSTSHLRNRTACSPNLLSLSQPWEFSAPDNAPPFKSPRYSQETPCSTRNTYHHLNILPRRKDSVTSGSSAISSGCMFAEPIQRRELPYQKERTYYSSSHFRPHSNSALSSSSESLSFNRRMSTRHSQTQRDLPYCKGTKEQYYQHPTLPSHSFDSSIPDLPMERLSLHQPVPMTVTGREHLHYPKDMPRYSEYRLHHSLTNQSTPHSNRYYFDEADPSDERMFFHRPMTMDPTPRERLYYPKETPHYSEYHRHRSLTSQSTRNSHSYNFYEPDLSDDRTFFHHQTAAPQERLHYPKEAPHYSEVRRQHFLTSQSTPYSRCYNSYEPDLSDEHTFFHRMDPAPRQGLYYPKETPQYSEYHRQHSANHSAPYSHSCNSSEADFSADWPVARDAGPQRQFQDTHYYSAYGHRQAFTDYLTRHSHSFMPGNPTEDMRLHHPMAWDASFHRERRYSEQIPYHARFSGSYNYPDGYFPNGHSRYDLPRSQSSSSFNPYSFGEPRYQPIFVEPVSNRHLQESSQDAPYHAQYAYHYSRNLPPYSNNSTFTSAPVHALPTEQFVLHRSSTYRAPHWGPLRYYQENPHLDYL